MNHEIGKDKISFYELYTNFWINLFKCQDLLNFDSYW